jgi:hypothetical protein
MDAKMSKLKTIGIWLGLIAVFGIPIYKSGWSFTTWLRDVLDITWPLAFTVAIISFPIALLMRYGKDPNADSEYYKQNYWSLKYNKIEEAYKFLLISASSALIGFFVLWLLYYHS